MSFKDFFSPRFNLDGLTKIGRRRSVRGGRQTHLQIQAVSPNGAVLETEIWKSTRWTSPLEV